MNQVTSHTTSASLAPMGGAILQWRQVMAVTIYCSFLEAPPSRTCRCAQCAWYFAALLTDEPVRQEP